jgi:hypothetical protein
MKELKGEMERMGSGCDIIGSNSKQRCPITVSNCQQQQHRHASAHGVPSALALGQTVTVHKQLVVN